MPGGLLDESAARRRILLDDRLVLYAGANMPSERAEAAYQAALSAYPAMGAPFDKEQPDTELVSRLEREVAARAASLFGAEWAEVRLPGCTLANLAVFLALTRPGDLMLGPAARHGGHLSQRRGGTPEIAGLRVEDLPFDGAACRLDSGAAAEKIRALRPTLVLLGRSVVVRADLIEAVVDAAREVAAITVYDASHVAGLIAGGVFPNPFDAGVDLVTTSTYKTLQGRPHALILGRSTEHRKRISAVITQRLIANADAGKLPSLLVTLREAEDSIAEYARRVVANASALAMALRARGRAVVAPEETDAFTHQLLLPWHPQQPVVQGMRAFEAAGILIGTCADPRMDGRHALRIGTQFITTRGLGPQDMAGVADRLTAVAAGDGENWRMAD
jgi:glycine hydroxymethyltransferase